MIIETKDQQKTLCREITFDGVGLHTGRDVTVSIKPSAENTGILFSRTDLDGNPIVKASINNVYDTQRSTFLRQNDVEIMTCEHLLAALYCLQVDNALIEINAPELPILDGSSMQYVTAIQNVGLKTQDAFRKEYKVTETLSFFDESSESEIYILPSEAFKATVTIDYGTEIIGAQSAEMKSLDHFVTDIANARTFCFLHEVESLIEKGLIKGASLTNAIVYVDRNLTSSLKTKLSKIFGIENVSVKPNGILDNLTLHYKNEAARHKLLDVIGDLALIGYPIRGHVIAKKPGHAINTSFGKKIKKLIDAELKHNTFQIDTSKRKDTLDVNAIMKRLPHRPPFLFIDRILELTETRVIGIKNTTINETFFPGHFPGEPVMPGVLQLEAMAQVGGILVLGTAPDPENYLTYFLKIDNARFKNKVVPGDTLVFVLDLIDPVRRGLCHMQGYAYVNGSLVCQAELLAQIVKVKN